MTMGVPNVLDTAALINWPIELLDGGYVVENQRLELVGFLPNGCCLLKLRISYGRARQLNP